MSDPVKFSTANVGSLAEGGIDVWVDLGKENVGSAAQILKRSDICIQVSGDFGLDAEVLIEGSNFVTPNDEQWSSVTDVFGTPMVFSDENSMRDIPSSPLWIRPRVSGGNVDTKISVLMRRVTK